MKLTNRILGMLLLTCGTVLSQSAMKENLTKLDLDRQAIKSMCGCYQVGFNFAETFNYSKDSLYKPSKVKQEKALEWVHLVEDNEDKIVMQHLLVVGPKQNQKIIKHWRQDWLFENQDGYTYDADNRWHYVSYTAEEIRGKWTQRVAQVDDSPRYEGVATWVHIDGKSSWESNADAPLPRREHTTRNDYNVLVRTNHVLVYHDLWIHDQDNKKVIRRNGQTDVLLAQEKGHNVYKKVEDSKCLSAQNWWAKNHEHWDSVRGQWNETIAKREDIIL